ncbi:MAG: hypothetical protein ABR498_08800 [Candidatus Dormibacteria bacterium]
MYRFDEGTTPTTQLTNVSFQLTPNAWQLQSGHQLKLELTQDDFPTWRPDNEPATITITGLTLTLPIVASAPVDTPESPLAPLLPIGALIAAGAVAMARRRRLSSTR